MLRFQLGQITTLDAASLIGNMDATTRRQYVEIYRSLAGGSVEWVDLAHLVWIITVTAAAYALALALMRRRLVK